MVAEMSLHIDLITAPPVMAARLCRLTGHIAALSICLSTEREHYRGAGKSHKGRCPSRYSGMAFCFADKLRGRRLLGIGFPVVNRRGETLSYGVLIRCLEGGAIGLGSF